MADYVRTITSIAVHRSDETPVFGDTTIRVEIDDEAGGPFIVLRSFADIDDRGRVSIDPRQWPAVEAAVREIMVQFEASPSAD